MKTTRFFSLILTGSLVLGCLALWPLAGAATTSTNAPAAVKGKPGDPATTNAVKAPLPIPNSVFDTALAPTKDPFFPNSIRQPITHKNVKEVVGVTASSFHLMAMSGSTDARLAMINHRTLSVGEAVEVPVPNSPKVTIRLMQIKENSVIIRVVSPSQPDLIELSLSKGAQ
jgi:hypothetical protein